MSWLAPAGKKWGDLEFPLPFGRTMTSAEEHVHEMDGKTGASLKLSILNPKVPRLQGSVLSSGQWHWHVQWLSSSSASSTPRCQG